MMALEAKETRKEGALSSNTWPNKKANLVLELRVCVRSGF